MYYVIYDGNCNLCVNLVRILESLDRGERFQYAPMQDQQILDEFGVTAADCEQGMLLINAENPAERWQGSDAAEEIGHLLPAGSGFVQAYRAMPGLKWTGDRLYEQVRDHRYRLFGQRQDTYWPQHPVCEEGCAEKFRADTESEI
jgi:predicted DCC family thiol-disulfide oxidoreductase YuxK